MSVVTGRRQREFITPAREDQVVLMIREWSPRDGKLTASSLARKVPEALKFTCTRQGLLKRHRIRSEFEARCRELDRGKERPPRPADEVILRSRIEHLLGQLADRDAKLATYKELIVRHHANANKYGITVAQLEVPLMPLAGNAPAHDD